MPLFLLLFDTLSHFFINWFCDCSLLRTSRNLRTWYTWLKLAVFQEAILQVSWRSLAGWSLTAIFLFFLFYYILPQIWYFSHLPFIGKFLHSRYLSLVFKLGATLDGYFFLFRVCFWEVSLYLINASFAAVKLVYFSNTE